MTIMPNHKNKNDERSLDIPDRAAKDQSKDGHQGAIPFPTDDILIVAIDPLVSRIGFAGGLTVDGGGLSLDDGDVLGFDLKNGRDDDLDFDAAILQLSGALDAGAAREEGVVFHPHFGDGHTVVFDHVVGTYQWMIHN